MGWFWGGNKNNDNDKDPTKSLDPTLKEFLDSQQPRPYIPAQAPPLQTLPTPQPIDPSPPPPKRPSTDTTLSDTNSKDAPANPVPTESLFPDGRYAHLWSTYTPQDTLTASSTTPLERLVSARKDRRDLLHRAALENCAFEHELQQTCFSAGTAAQRAKARLTMCREEGKAFNRCFSLQTKFLQALGYMGRAASTDEEEERIQMHADKLYHRMMDYEASVHEARRTQGPIPPLSSVFEASKPAPSVDELKALPGNLQRRLKQPLEELAPHERELAVAAALQEAKMTYLYTDEMRRFAEDMDKKRRERQRWVGSVFGEPIGKFVIPDLEPPREEKGRKEDDLERDSRKEKKK
jgi:hypothetical protein